jgi:serine/threonine protein kinase
MKVLGSGEIVGGRYVVVRLLGGGGMKRVYLAEDLRLAHRGCALAELIDIFSDQDARQQAIRAFEREAEMLAGLDNEHIPRVHDCFSEKSQHYLVMEYVSGETLEQKLVAAGGKLGEAVVVDIALQVLNPVKYLHSINPPVIYRDLKPSNIMIEPSGRVKLIDFGIARFFQPAKTATMIGTAGYAPPEQYRGKVDQRSDLYALAATMHHALSGRDPTTEPPFSFPPARDVCKNCNRDLAALIDHALAYESSQRITSADVFERRLLACTLVSPTAPTLRIQGPQTNPSASKSVSHRTRLWLIGLGLIGVVISVGYSLSEQSSSAPPVEKTDLTPAHPESTSTPAPLAPETAVVISTSGSDTVGGLVPENVGRTKSAALHGSKKRRVSAERGTKAVEIAATEPTSIDKRLSVHRYYFTLGSSKEEVLAIQGTPTSIISGGGFIGDTWSYGFSSVSFTKDGAVKGYSNISGNLHVTIETTHAENGGSYFTLGSSKEKVLAIQGTPTSIISGEGFIGDTWSYDFSSVSFTKDGAVKGYSNISDNLHVRVK